MHVQRFSIDDPSRLQHILSPVLSSEVAPAGKIGDRFDFIVSHLSSDLSVIGGQFSPLSGIYHSKGMWITLPYDPVGYFFDGQNVGTGADPLTISISDQKKMHDFSIVHPHEVLILFANEVFFRRTYERMNQRAYDEGMDSSLQRFSDVAMKRRLLQLVLSVSINQVRKLSPLESADLTVEIMETFFTGLDKEKPLHCRNQCANLALKAHAYLIAHPKKNVTVSEVCDYLGAPERSIQRGFKQVYNMGLIDYHRIYRLFQIRKYLKKNPKRKLGEVILEYGFHHAGRFSQMYKNSFGVLPSKEGSWEHVDTIFSGYS